MRTLIITCVLQLLLCSKLKAQKKLNCELNLKIVNHELSLPNSKENYPEIIELLKPCAEKGEAEAQFLLGRIYQVQQTEATYLKAFTLFKKAAKQDHGLAMVHLGDLYKNGNGVDVNIKKAKKWYKKAHELGNQKGTYALGYLFYKGLGGVPQNYEKAVQLFEQSSYPMAKHWLAMSYFFGNGVRQDRDKAIELLKTQNSLNETTLISCMEKHKHSSFELTDFQKKVLENSKKGIKKSTSAFSGTWDGTLLQMDWSEQKVVQQIPVSIAFKKGEQEPNFNYELATGNYSNSGTASLYADEFIFDDLQITLDRNFYATPSEKTIDYLIKHAEASIKLVDEKEYLIVSLTNYASKLKELGGDFKMILTKRKTQTQNGVEISQEALEHLQGASNTKFIKLYPNPFSTELFVAYNLTKESHIRIEATHLNTGSNQIIEEGKQQREGEYIYYLNGNQLQQGMYVITVYVDGEKKTETIIKN
ncbi:tetratricopeptide repeat protein [Tenacibaculum agarivorans]|uniref:tetratricopeptide repeat protein n=1 Tax=Tenacibaculum agarivorans TaxID=1908389 RepID=UPI0009F8AAD1|nr:tetratricopeptide repeat protein [Tenacibaculum agarivorans]